MEFLKPHPTNGTTPFHLTDDGLEGIIIHHYNDHTIYYVGRKTVIVKKHMKMVE